MPGMAPKTAVPEATTPERPRIRLRRARRPGQKPPANGIPKGDSETARERGKLARPGPRLRTRRAPARSARWEHGTLRAPGACHHTRRGGGGDEYTDRQNSSSCARVPSPGRLRPRGLKAPEPGRAVLGI